MTRTAAWTLTVLHALALIGGLFGILIAIPHPELWSASPSARAFYAFAIDKTGGLSMILGALAMIAYGVWSLGARRTAIFFLAATIVSACAELTGTKTGWPFGGYEYTSFLGWKILGRVPFAIPLSWFYVSLASYVLADAIVRRTGIRARTPAAILLATWFLVAWDLVLDPSMAAPQLQYIHFWIWHERGPYFGMPLRNLAGWFATGALFTTIARICWRSDVPDDADTTIPFTIYALNVVWSMILSVAAGMWPTAIAAIAFALTPAALALGKPRRRPAAAPSR
ncbi:MAG TPA: carotenoid biosynthesis protein [Candidatus Baltobacteraceae bacterium]|nr:carotenoid biosynthesis protein [Candidatus Baltobacteraceae bacterium]